MINKLNLAKISPKIIIWHFTFLGQRSSSHVRSMKSIILKYEWLFYVIRKYILSSPQTNQLIGIWWPYYKVQCHQKPLKSFFHSLFVFKDIDNRVFFSSHTHWIGYEYVMWLYALLSLVYLNFGSQRSRSWQLGFGVPFRSREPTKLAQFVPLISSNIKGTSKFII